MRISVLPVAISLTLVAAACGGGGGDDDSVDTSADPAPVATEGEVTAEPAGTSETGGESVPATEAAAVDGGGEDEGGSDGGGSSSAAMATLDLENGESYEFSILCMLESQEAAGSEILFNAVSYDDPGLDITQFGDEGAVTDMAVISVYDGSYDTLWEASSVYEAFGGSIELRVEGSTIIGSGSFYAAADPTSEPVQGDLQANC